MKRISVYLALLAVVLLLAGCAGQGGTTITSPPSSTALTTTESTTTTTVAAPSTTATTTGSTLGVSTTTGATGVTAVPGKTYSADLSGKDVVPAVETTATGSASFTVDATGTRIRFVLSVTNITDVIAARVRVGKPGSNGSGVLILYPGPTRSGAFTGNLSGGTFSASALIGTLAGKTIADFVALITSGQAYVNVGTLKNPGGEIRGQIH